MPSSGPVTPMLPTKRCQASFEKAEHAGRDLDDGRPVLGEIGIGIGVKGRGVGGDHEGLGIHQLLEDGDPVRPFGPGIGQTLAHAVHRHGADVVEKHLHAAHAVEVVIDRGDRGVGRHAVEELERADRRLDLVGDGNRVEFGGRDVRKGGPHGNGDREGARRA